MDETSNRFSNNLQRETFLTGVWQSKGCTIMDFSGEHKVFVLTIFKEMWWLSDQSIIQAIVKKRNSGDTKICWSAVNIMCQTGYLTCFCLCGVNSHKCWRAATITVTNCMSTFILNHLSIKVWNHFCFCFVCIHTNKHPVCARVEQVILFSIAAFIRTAGKIKKKGYI